MNEITKANLRSAFAGESQAHLRYIAFASKAEIEGKKNISNLFKAISHAEKVHATNHYLSLAHEKGDFLVTANAPFGYGTTSENLQACMNGETFEITEMYPVYKATAEMQGEKRAQQSFTWALESEKKHLEMYTKAKEAADKGSDIEAKTIQICEVCGYTLEGEAPDKCPVCNAKKQSFQSFP